MMQSNISKRTGLYYRVNAFLPERETLVFVHGFSGSSSAWQPYEAALDSTYNLLTYDLRGHGYSPKSAKLNDYALAQNAEDLLALLDELHIVKPTVISHSYGALIMLQFVQHHQNRLAKLILCSGSYAPSQQPLGPLVKAFAVMGTALMQWLPFSLKPALLFLPGIPGKSQ